MVLPLCTGVPPWHARCKGRPGNMPGRNALQRSARHGTAQRNKRARQPTAPGRGCGRYVRHRGLRCVAQRGAAAAQRAGARRATGAASGQRAQRRARQRAQGGRGHGYSPLPLAQAASAAGGCGCGSMAAPLGAAATTMAPLPTLPAVLLAWPG